MRTPDGRERWSRRTIPWTMLSFGMISGTAFALFGALLLGGGVFRYEPLALAIPLGWIAIRPRVTAFDPGAREITFSWGDRLPIVYARLSTDDVASTEIRRVFPVGVTPVGGRMNVTRLPAYCDLRAITKKGRRVSVGTFRTEDEARAAAERLLR